MRTPLRPLVVSAAALSVLLAGQVAAQAATSHRPTTTITVDGSRHVVMTSTLRPGTARLHDRSARSVYLLRTRHGAGVPSLVKDWNSSTSTGFKRDFVTIGHMPGDSTIVTSLPRGTYYAVDGDLSHLTSKLVKQFAVSGQTENASRPASVAVTVGSAQTMRSPATLPAHRFTHIVNTSAYPQQIALVRYHATKAQLQAFLAHPTLVKLDQIATAFHPVSLLDAHRSLYTDARPAAGKYLIVNFSYGKPNKPRFTHGQAHLITVA